MWIPEPADVDVGAARRFLVFILPKIIEYTRSCLFSMTQFAKTLETGPESLTSVPSVRNIQVLRIFPLLIIETLFKSIIENAWRDGFDAEGAAHFKNKLTGTRQWIGASGDWIFFSNPLSKMKFLDISAMLGFLNIRYQEGEVSKTKSSF